MKPITVLFPTVSKVNEKINMPKLTHLLRAKSQIISVVSEI